MRRQPHHCNPTGWYCSELARGAIISVTSRWASSGGAADLGGQEGGPRLYLGSLRKIKTFHKAATPQFYHKAALSEVNRLREHSPSQRGSYGFGSKLAKVALSNFGSGENALTLFRKSWRSFTQPSKDSLKIVPNSFIRTFYSDVLVKPKLDPKLDNGSKLRSWQNRF